MSIKEFEDKPPEAQLLPPLLLGATLDMVVAYVMAWVPLVGRITVKDVSEARPEKYKGEDGIDCDYPFGNKPGRRPDNSPLSGSGYVYSVSNETGRCKSCRASSPGGWWQRVGVDTARHNVYDDVEARSATFTLFNDSPHNPDQVTLTGGEWYGGSTEKDWCVLYFHHHDRALGSRLTELCRSQEKAEKTLFRHVPIVHHDSPDSAIGLPVVLAGHPHGRCKMISVGEVRGAPPGGGGISAPSWCTAPPPAPATAGVWCCPWGGGGSRRSGSRTTR